MYVTVCGMRREGEGQIRNGSEEVVETVSDKRRALKNGYREEITRYR